MNNTRKSFYDGAPRLGSSRFRKGKSKKAKMFHKLSATARPVPGSGSTGPMVNNHIWVPDPDISGGLITAINKDFKDNVEGKDNLQSALGALQNSEVDWIIILLDMSHMHSSNNPQPYISSANLLYVNQTLSLHLLSLVAINGYDGFNKALGVTAGVVISILGLIFGFWVYKKYKACTKNNDTKNSNNKLTPPNLEGTGNLPRW